jgi:hypothetical protein
MDDDIHRHILAAIQDEAVPILRRRKAELRKQFPDYERVQFNLGRVNEQLNIHLRFTNTFGDITLTVNVDDGMLMLHNPSRFLSLDDEYTKALPLCDQTVDPVQWVIREVLWVIERNESPNERILAEWLAPGV